MLTTLEHVCIVPHCRKTWIRLPRHGLTIPNRTPRIECDVDRHDGGSEEGEEDDLPP